MRITRDLMKNVIEGDVQHMQIAAVDYLQKFVDVRVDAKGRVVFKPKNNGLAVRLTPMIFIKRGILKFEECDDGNYTVALECSYGLSSVIFWLGLAALFIATDLSTDKISNEYCWGAAILWGLLIFNQLCMPGAYLKAAIKRRMLKKKKAK